MRSRVYRAAQPAVLCFANLGNCCVLPAHRQRHHDAVVLLKTRLQAPTPQSTLSIMSYEILV